MATKKKVETVKPVQKYHFYNSDYEIYAEDSTNEEFISDVRDNGESVDDIFYRIPVQLLEKIKVTSQIVKA